MSNNVGKKYLRQDVITDDNQYENCEFIECNLIYEGGEPASFINCTFDAGGWAFRGPAGRTVIMLKEHIKPDSPFRKRLLEFFDLKDTDRS
jgi:hypothetical protein